MYLLRCSFEQTILEIHLIRPTMIAAYAFFGLTSAAVADTAGEDAATEVSEAGAPAPWQPEDGDVIEFKVLRKGKDFGTHIVTFDVSGDGSFTATSDVDLKAGLGPITVFRYALDSTEMWRDGKLVKLTGRTNDDGDKETVEAVLADGQLAIDGSGFSGNAALEIIPSSHWNRKEAYSSKLLSTESGEVLDVSVSEIGREWVEVAGETIPATHYRLVSDITVDLWYDDQSRWVKLGFEARGQQIDYVLQNLY